ncbi:MAG: hypothetical protein SFX72_17395 [Isosphaeraceae bacterium]|nr:hypothetical protein [Isosphaeraceae bacterium]
MQSRDAENSTNRWRGSRARRAAAGLIASSLWVGCGETVDPPRVVPPSVSTPAREPGLAVGARAPEVSALDSTGARRRLAELNPNGPLAVVFLRSGDW